MSEATDDAPSTTVVRLRAALTAVDPSTRLQAALAAGTRPDPAYAGVLIDRCAVEPDFFVRDMLTWALTRLDPTVTVPGLLAELTSAVAQGRSQALHTLSKIGDPRGWSGITRELLQDDDDQVARAAWRAAVVLAPDGNASSLAETFATQLARGDRETWRSLSRAFAGLGDAAETVLTAAGRDGSFGVRTHALATLRMLSDPDEDFDTAIFESERSIVFPEAPLETPHGTPQQTPVEVVTPERGSTQDALAARIRTVLVPPVTVREVRMFGGLSFMVDGKLAVAASRDGDLLVRTDPAQYDELSLRGGEPARMRNGRQMGRGWLTVPAARLEQQEDLAFWVAVGIDSRNAPRSGPADRGSANTGPTGAGPTESD